MAIKRYYRNKVTGKVSPKMDNVIKDRVTLKSNFEVTYFNNMDTPFEEIEIVPVEEIFPYNELSNIESGSRVISLSLYIKEMRKVLLDSLEKVWNPKKFHFILHSSGYDSRILSMSIRELYLKNGKDWLGDVLFLCRSPEEESFKQVMRYEGWNKSQYAVLKFKPFEYDIEGFDYKVTWKHVNGVGDAPVNFVYNLYETSKKRGLIPLDDSKIQIWSNWFETVLIESNFINFKKRYANSYYGAEARTWSMVDCEICDMYLGLEVVKFRIEVKPDNFFEAELKSRKYWSGWRWVKGKKIDDDYNCSKLCKLRELILGDELAKFKRWDWEDFDFIWAISDKLLQKAIDDYKNSWYYKNVDKKIINSAVNYYWERPYRNSHKWWNAWSMGSFTNHLIARGVEIDG